MFCTKDVHIKQLQILLFPSIKVTKLYNLWRINVLKTKIVHPVIKYIVKNTVKGSKSYFSISTVTLSFGHKSCFISQCKGHKCEYNSSEQLEIGLHAR